MALPAAAESFRKFLIIQLLLIAQPFTAGNKQKEQNSLGDLSPYPFP
jgi:hypothetical protein